MKIDVALLTSDLGRAGARARELEELGVDGLFTFDGPHEPFLALTHAAAATERVSIGTGVAVAFARSPMIVAQLAHALQTQSRGRFVLGIGSQVKAHIERRFAMPWSRPAARMHEYVRALRAIWAAWNEGEPLRFEGELYRHTLLPPTFNPGPTGQGPPPVLVAGVGPVMTRVAGEVGDGFLAHPFHSVASLEQVTLPALDEGLARSGRSRDGFTLACQALVVTGRDEDAVRGAREVVRHQIAFYASTPAYASVLEAEGRPDLQPELQALTREGRWAEMGERIDDGLLECIAVCGEPAVAAAELRRRYAGRAQRVAIASPYEIDDATLHALLEALGADRSG